MKKFAVYAIYINVRTTLWGRADHAVVSVQHNIDYVVPIVHIVQISTQKQRKNRAKETNLFRWLYFPVFFLSKNLTKRPIDGIMGDT